MQTDTATALADELAAVNKSVRLQTFTLKILEHVETHRPAPSAARFRHGTANNHAQRHPSGGNKCDTTSWSCHCMGADCIR
ncbi:hypothetical protein HBI47_251040 [Parastagonospora nodorum]|nr:hypothetical protein HBI47_251040 [Parastagonospora nodorum]